MLTMESDFAKRYSTREELLERQKGLAEEIQAMLNSPLPDNDIPRVRARLREMVLLPADPPVGFQFLLYAKQLLTPLAVGPERAQEFARNWKGWK